ncbi:FAD-dependent oxidoreductase [Ponticoccus sp. SC2-23]|uniref:NAD(P)/FAD-dependent oxidoreductase n=1 Tax=Alexandriicola marinus TaxID=2081710 RepID=UPI000FD7B512|nr:NAD(P)/FAD-dependent oxidoreductase [Alexandriicola marinus]MBM1220220.1 FAD-dependent oxidoreductase [Ponticoccus sp. SC6-9]MBM1224906.1 FAD-dependent oxidoreductase [Ponticoccus sp. SC6-15]MBM1228420.1 FAD-dependent oxidoreductase [Ponticoccus sp. SC6-38]MBM1233943.1 FAD-dependent oxidoreductase [Ponticoccus sp. SC6-45]MBM1238921.1 FAD-dependent oxidoreductase [Ponticoccus sp. SC6-49]MBM1242703.1 FAD-dependent oxidoreductase [Ponticoccus sp. SC2-64]MBM1247467.1 FAD-dependent oxidoreduct
MKINRRSFIGSAAAGVGVMSAPMVMGAAHGTPNVVVIGGGAGGATAARYIARDGGDQVNVTLIEPTRTYYTCFFSNLYIGGFRTMESLGHSYGTLASEYGINVVHDWAVGVDRDAKTVALAGGGSVPYDKLILSPGIDFVDGAVPGWDVSAQNAMPHAYKAGSQTELLKAQVMSMREGGTYCMVAPPNPYRCPPGPYERVSMVAHQLKQTNPTAKILIVDPKEGFSKQGLFEQGWERHYSGMIERIGPDFGGANVEVDPAAMTVTIDGVVENVDVCNVIPAQRAGKIAHDAGVTDGNWAPVEAFALTSKMDPAIHVLGDSAAQGDMPKSGFSANSQAKVCANAVVGELTGSRVFPARFSNTCWSLIDTEDGVKVGAAYEPTEEKIASTGGFVSQTDETAEVRAQTYQESLGWYDAIVSDMFG